MQRCAGPGPDRDFDVYQDPAGRVLDLERFGQEPDGRVLRPLKFHFGPENRCAELVKTRSSGSRSYFKFARTGPDRTGIQHHQDPDRTGPGFLADRTGPDWTGPAEDKTRDQTGPS